jgi:hypothetical protein
MSKHRMLLTLDDEAADLLEQLTTPRKKGEYISEMIKRSVPVEVDESAGILERIEQRLQHVEALLIQMARKDSDDE